MKFRIQQTIEGRKWIYRIQQRRCWFWWKTLPETYKTRGEAREVILALQYEGEFKPWSLDAAS